MKCLDKGLISVCLNRLRSGMLKEKKVATPPTLKSKCNSELILLFYTKKYNKQDIGFFDSTTIN